MAQSSTACLFARTSQLSLRARGCSPGLREAALRCVSRNTTCAASLTTGGFACIRDRVWLGTECMAGRLVPHARLSSAPGHAPPPLPSLPRTATALAPHPSVSHPRGKGEEEGKGKGRERREQMTWRTDGENVNPLAHFLSTRTTSICALLLSCTGVAREVRREGRRALR